MRQVFSFSKLFFFVARLKGMMINPWIYILRASLCPDVEITMLRFWFCLGTHSSTGLFQDNLNLSRFFFIQVSLRADADAIACPKNQWPQHVQYILRLLLIHVDPKNMII